MRTSTRGTLLGTATTLGATGGGGLVAPVAAPPPADAAVLPPAQAIVASRIASPASRRATPAARAGPRRVATRSSAVLLFVPTGPALPGTGPIIGQQLSRLARFGYNKQGATEGRNRKGAMPW